MHGFLQPELGPGEALTVSPDDDIVGVGGCLKLLFGREGRS